LQWSCNWLELKNLVAMLIVNHLIFHNGCYATLKNTYCCQLLHNNRKISPKKPKKSNNLPNIIIISSNMIQCLRFFTMLNIKGGMLRFYVQLDTYWWLITWLTLITLCLRPELQSCSWLKLAYKVVVLICLTLNCYWLHEIKIFNDWNDQGLT
jgi:hypothetical protein